MIKNGFNAHVIMWKKEDLKKSSAAPPQKLVTFLFILDTVVVG